ncbi:unnamed protein product [Amoebophrya sp. A25]|nr:unnamed protein product [Amoebophrya sp. A25]|eukprot:GSA25T00024342001.1
MSTRGSNKLLKEMADWFSPDAEAVDHENPVYVSVWSRLPVVSSIVTRLGFGNLGHLFPRQEPTTSSGGGSSGDGAPGGVSGAAQQAGQGQAYPDGQGNLPHEVGVAPEDSGRVSFDAALRLGYGAFVDKASALLTKELTIEQMAPQLKPLLQDITTMIGGQTVPEAMMQFVRKFFLEYFDRADEGMKLDMLMGYLDLPPAVARKLVASKKYFVGQPGPGESHATTNAGVEGVEGNTASSTEQDVVLQYQQGHSHTSNGEEGRAERGLSALTRRITHALKSKGRSRSDEQVDSEMGAAPKSLEELFASHDLSVIAPSVGRILMHTGPVLQKTMQLFADHAPNTATRKLLQSFRENLHNPMETWQLWEQLCAHPRSDDSGYEEAMQEQIAAWAVLLEKQIAARIEREPDIQETGAGEGEASLQELLWQMDFAEALRKSPRASAWHQNGHCRLLQAVEKDSSAAVKFNLWRETTPALEKVSLECDSQSLQAVPHDEPTRTKCILNRQLLSTGTDVFVRRPHQGSAGDGQADGDAQVWKFAGSVARAYGWNAQATLPGRGAEDQQALALNNQRITEGVVFPHIAPVSAQCPKKGLPTPAALFGNARWYQSEYSYRMTSEGPSSIHDGHLRTADDGYEAMPAAEHHAPRSARFLPFPENHKRDMHEVDIGSRTSRHDMDSMSPKVPEARTLITVLPRSGNSPILNASVMQSTQAAVVFANRIGCALQPGYEWTCKRRDSASAKRYEPSEFEITAAEDVGSGNLMNPFLLEQNSHRDRELQKAVQIGPISTTNTWLVAAPRYVGEQQGRTAGGAGTPAGGANGGVSFSSSPSTPTSSTIVLVDENYYSPDTPSHRYEFSSSPTAVGTVAQGHIVTEVNTNKKFWLRVQRPYMAERIRSEKYIFKNIFVEAWREHAELTDEREKEILQDKIVATKAGLDWNFSRIEAELDLEEEIRNLQMGDKCYNSGLPMGESDGAGSMRFVKRVGKRAVLTEHIRGVTAQSWATSVGASSKQTTCKTVENLNALLQKWFHHALDNPDHTFFHADPHAGNIMVNPETGDVAFIDFGFAWNSGKNQLLPNFRRFLTAVVFQNYATFQALFGIDENDPLMIELREKLPRIAEEVKSIEKRIILVATDIVFRHLHRVNNALDGLREFLLALGLFNDVFLLIHAEKADDLKSCGRSLQNPMTSFLWKMAKDTIAAGVGSVAASVRNAFRGGRS